VIDERLPRVDGDDEVVGRHTLWRWRKRQELDPGMIVRRDTSATHHFVILTARRITTIHFRR
jgi:hypothetical protein